MKKYWIIRGLLLVIVLVTVNCEEKQSTAMAPPATTIPASNEMMFNDSQMKLANITTEAVTMRDIGEKIVLNGKLVTNEDNVEVVSARVSGRIEKLFVKETGKIITKGEPLYELYSEQLLTMQKEFLFAKEQYETLGADEKRYASFLAAAERKLVLFGMTKEQIGKLVNAKKADSRITFVSPSAGITRQINVSEGQSVQEGTTLYQLENIQTLWVEAELYPSETTLIRIGDLVEVSVDGVENLQARITFLSPEIRGNSQVTILRAVVDNHDGVLRAGTQAQIFLSRSQKKTITLPIDAVIRDQHGAHVYVQQGRNTFRPRMVSLGIEDGNRVEITEGLNEADTVAMTGAYLIYSEYILKRGADPMAVHQH